MLVVYPLEEEENGSIAKRLRLMLSDVALLKVREDVCNTGQHILLLVWRVCWKMKRLPRKCFLTSLKY